MRSVRKLEEDLRGRVRGTLLVDEPLVVFKQPVIGNKLLKEAALFVNWM